MLRTNASVWLYGLQEKRTILLLSESGHVPHNIRPHADMSRLEQTFGGSARVLGSMDEGISELDEARKVCVGLASWFYTK